MADTIRYGTTTDQEGKDRYFEREADLPGAREFGPGLAIIGDTATLKVSDGEKWSPYIGTFTPSIYSGTKSATTTVTGQSEAVATGATKIQVVNKDATNSAYIGFGMSAAEAEAACSTGIPGTTKFLILADSSMLQNLGNFTHYAWLGVGGTVSMRVTQGV